MGEVVCVGSEPVPCSLDNEAKGGELARPIANQGPLIWDAMGLPVKLGLQRHTCEDCY